MSSGVGHRFGMMRTRVVTITFPREFVTIVGGIVEFFRPLTPFVSEATVCIKFQEGGCGQRRATKCESLPPVGGFEPTTFTFKSHDFIRWATAGQHVTWIWFTQWHNPPVERISKQLSNHRRGSAIGQKNKYFRVFWFYSSRNRHGEHQSFDFSLNAN